MTPEAGFEKRVLDSAAKQKRIIEFVALFREEHGFPPTIREITRGAEISSTSMVSYHLTLLVEKGFLTKDPNSARTIVLTPEGKDFIAQQDTDGLQNH